MANLKGGTLIGGHLALHSGLENAYLAGNLTLGSLTSNDLTASTVLVTDSNKKLVSSTITSTKLGYLSDVTSNLQAQINGKAASSHTHSYLPLAGGTITSSATTGSAVSIVANSLTSGKALNISSTSTATTTSGNSLINLSKSGANATSGAISTGIFGTITNTGTDSHNIGMQFDVFGGSSNVGLVVGVPSGANDYAIVADGKSLFEGQIISEKGSGAPISVASTTVCPNLNADMVDGLHIHTGRNNEANKIVRTDANGYINAGWINTTSGDNSTTTITRVYASSDAYIRYYTLTNFSNQVLRAASSATIGSGCTASVTNAVATGYQTTASGDYSHAEGRGTTASGYASHAEGYQTITSGYYSHAEGYNTEASGQRSHAEGSQTEASGYGSHAEGFYTTASGDYSHAEGYYTAALGVFSHAEGNNTEASGNQSHAGGHYTVAQGYCQTAIGKYNIAQGTSTSCIPTDHAFIIGNGTSSTRSNALTVTWGGDLTAGKASFTSATIGSGCTASVTNAFAIGKNTTASGDYSHAEGNQSLASGNISHAEGFQTTASGYYSHAEGTDTTASGYGSHAEGFYTTASGYGSHAEGYKTKASGYYSHAGGYYTIAQGYAQKAIGMYNIAQGTTTSYTSTDHAFIIGNGTNNASRSNALSVTWNGDLTCKTVYFPLYDNGNSGTAKTINWNNSIKEKMTLTGNCTLSFTAPLGPCNLTLMVYYSSSTAYTITWPATVKWAGGTAPTPTRVSGKYDIFTFFYDGIYYYGMAGLNF
jgi:hypothetical protein